MRPRIPSPVQAADFRLFYVGDQAPATLSGMAQLWLDAGQVKQSIEDFVAFAGFEFAGEFFLKVRVVGVLQCDTTTRYEADTEWLLLANTARVSPDESLLSRVVSAKDGEFFFFPMSQLTELGNAEVRVAVKSLTMPKRFFAFFGGLRISMPHLGGTYFRRQPGPCPSEMIASKRALAQWKGAALFYVIDHCDYLILNKRGEVGYVPIDANRSIELYASDFDDFLRRWLSDSVDAFV